MQRNTIHDDENACKLHYRIINDVNERQSPKDLSILFEKNTTPEILSPTNHRELLGRK